MESEYAEFSQIKETFLATLALGPCLIVFDGLDELSATMGYSMIEVTKAILYNFSNKFVF